MKGFQCDELFAFVSVDKDGNEGIDLPSSAWIALELEANELIEELLGQLPESSEVVQLDVDILRHGECVGGNIFRGLFHYRWQRDRPG